MAVTCAVGNDGRSLLVAMTGELMLTDVAVLRVRLLKCLAEQPEALLIDLSALTVTEPLALSVFTAVVHQAARWPGTPVLLCAPGPQTRALLASGAYDRLPLFASTHEARKPSARINRASRPSATNCCRSTVPPGPSPPLPFHKAIR